MESDSLGCGHTGKIDGGVFARSQDCTVELAGNFADLYWHRHTKDYECRSLFTKHTNMTPSRHVSSDQVTK